jgi:proteasome lid subunit RPN8/RPN11
VNKTADASANDRPVYRTTPIPRGEIRGRYLVAEPVIGATQEALISFALAGIHDGGHEGIAFWAGREAPDYTLVFQAIVPEAEHSEGRVMVGREQVGRAARSARRDGMGILSQVHSHPGSDARHSDGDDQLILLPFENMLSIVAPNFGLQFTDMSGVCVHQYQDGRWVLCSQESVARNVIVVPFSVDLR